MVYLNDRLYSFTAAVGFKQITYMLKSETRTVLTVRKSFDFAICCNSINMSQRLYVSCDLNIYCHATQSMHNERHVAKIIPTLISSEMIIVWYIPYILYI